MSKTTSLKERKKRLVAIEKFVLAHPKTKFAKSPEYYYLMPFADLYEVIDDLLAQHTADVEREAENSVIDIANTTPCDCGSMEHLPTPVRSVSGAVTKYCQFSRVMPSEQLNHPKDSKGGRE